MKTETEPNEVTRSMLISITNDRLAFAKWAAMVDSIMVDSDLAEMRECFCVPNEFGRDLAR